MNNRESKIRRSAERERKSDEHYRKEKRGVKGRETLAEFKEQRELDLCRASRGKTGALLLQ